MRTKTVRLLCIVVSGAAVACLSACGGGGGSSPPGATSYQVTATAGTGGTISPAGATVNAASTTTLTVTANSGYAISSVTGCGGMLSGNTYTTAAINAACTVTASFVAQYVVTGTAGVRGTVSPASATVNAGGTTTLTVTPMAGYVVSGVTGCGGTLSGNTYTTGTINSDCTVTANFGAAFTWVSGPNTGNGRGIYGTQGVAAATNIPGPRDKAAAWTDKSGQQWLFGGEGYDSNGTFGELNDLWEYSPSSGEWTWMGGSNTVNATGIYGTLGMSAKTNVPGGRFGPATWTDANGNLWMLGGWVNLGTNQHWNDLWEYTPSSGEWTWVGGSNTPNATGVYGVQGAAAATNIPGGRTAAATWTDAGGNFWLFGGEGFDSAGTYGWLNDLWEYSLSNHNWTWVGGPNTTQATGVYGTQGVAAPTNIPGARAYEASWTDTNGNLWLFGGVGYDYTSSSYFYCNDLWKYSPANGLWMWVSGSSSVNATGVYGVQGTAAATNTPGARAGSAAWEDAGGNFWLLGGYWQNGTGSTFSYWNDLWEFSPSRGQWTWVGGPNTVNATGIYGAQGVAAATNMPGARNTSATWVDISGNVWLFGGLGVDSTGAVSVDMNDLWKLPAQ